MENSFCINDMNYLFLSRVSRGAYGYLINYFFHPLSRDLPARVRVCVREGGVKERNNSSRARWGCTGSHQNREEPGEVR